jgi:hypothetical protein
VYYVVENADGDETLMSQRQIRDGGTPSQRRMTTVDDLIAFLREWWDEDEAAALAAPHRETVASRPSRPEDSRANVTQVRLVGHR